ncbi:MAG: alpha-hydroxy-acid oxidizing protein [Hyphomicrobiales bacterium]|nr:alpha-hydroxy-acid oxidizing protein [Hyphomicrobiales bacterium]
MAATAAAERIEKLRRRFPTVEDLRRRARWRVPRFAFDFVDGSANDEECARRNSAALSAVELLPRYCIDPKGTTTEVDLFGRKYAAPFGVAPMGSGGAMWPGAEEYLAREAQRRNIPYVLATPANASIEQIAKIAPDVLWFQLYRFAANDHAITFDLLRRADTAGAHVLVPTIDSAGKSKRPRDIRSGFTLPFRVGPSTVFQVATSPLWALALYNNGMLRSENVVPYTAGPATRDSTAKVIMEVRSSGSHTWDELARLRDRWKRAFVVKGVLHPADAERLVALGADGLIVSNHGGRHFDGAPAAIDILPAIVAAVGSRTTVMVDSGIRGGLDIVRSLALGAKAVFAGRPFLYAVGALGEQGARHIVDLFFDELRTELQHVGARSVAEAATISARHPGAWRQGRDGAWSQ